MKIQIERIVDRHRHEAARNAYTDSKIIDHDRQGSDGSATVVDDELAVLVRECSACEPSTSTRGV